MEYFAIIKIQGKQFIIIPNQVYDLNFIKYSNIGDVLKSNKILLEYSFSYDEDLSLFYNSLLLGKSKDKLYLLVIQHFFSKNVIIFKYKPKKNYNRFINFRPKITRAFSFLK
jgi:ribosomal protein L21